MEPFKKWLAGKIISTCSANSGSVISSYKRTCFCTFNEAPKKFRFEHPLLNVVEGFPGGPLVKTLRVHCREHGVDPRLGN